jgi:ribose 5-phosphate isomerase B
MTIATGSDHAGFEHKNHLKKWLEQHGHTVIDYGTHSSESADYPDYAHPVADAVEHGTAQVGLLLCGSANGMAMAANKHAGIRAALCWNEEVAALARMHNNANIICIPARFTTIEQAQRILEKFLASQFEGGRHLRRVEKISC